MSSSPASIHSTAREHIAEHALLAALGRHIWVTRVRTGGEPMGVLRAESDNDGFDVLLSLEGVHRAVQLKTMSAGGRTKRFNINRKLERAPGGCVLVLVVGDDLDLEHFLFFGSDNPSRAVVLDSYESARHTRANVSDGERRLRPGIAVVKSSAFRRLDSIGEVASSLFGV